MTSVGSPVGNLGPTHLPYRTAVANATSGAPGTGGKLWLPIWEGEIIHAYDEYNMFEPLVQQRVISSGTTVEIPITGLVNLNPQWNAGEELVGGASNQATTFQLKLDKRPMAAHFEVDNIDLMLTQWEFRSELARQAALTLSNTRDKQLYSYLTRAAMTSQISRDRTDIRGDLNLDTALFGGKADATDYLPAWGSSAASTTHRTTGALYALEAVEKYIVYLQENNIPYNNLFMAISPQCFMDIRSLGVAREAGDLDDGGKQLYFNGQAGGGFASGLGADLRFGYGQIHDALEYMGCVIVKTNHGSDQLRNKTGEDASADGLGEAKYNMDWSLGQGGSDTTALKHGIRAVMWTPEAIAGIRLQGLMIDSVDDVRRNTTFTVASMMAGSGVLRPECAAVIHTRNASAEAWDTRAELASGASMDADGYAEAS
jgi:hypothetical protein